MVKDVEDADVLQLTEPAQLFQTVWQKELFQTLPVEAFLLLAPSEGLSFRMIRVNSMPAENCSGRIKRKEYRILLRSSVVLQWLLLVYLAMPESLPHSSHQRINTCEDSLALRIALIRLALTPFYLIGSR